MAFEQEREGFIRHVFRRLEAAAFAGEFLLQRMKADRVQVAVP